MNCGTWTALDEVRDAARHGFKALRLAELRRRGLPVLDGWVCEAGDAAALARALLELHPTPRWILRSSSTREDRPGDSAAGHFHSGSAPATIDAVAAQIQRVFDSGAAVLAQPHLAFERWCTVEVRGEAGRLETGDGELLSLDAEGAWSDLATLARRAARQMEIDPALLELGAHGERLFVLQIRPAPQRVPSSRRRPAPEPVAPRSIQVPGLGLHVHPGDEQSVWKADLEHCPVPLSPLLAGLFGRWILSRPPETTSRLHHGIWHDRERGPAPEVESAEADRLFETWRRGLQRLDVDLRALDEDVVSWPDFVERWLAWQADYFDLPSARCRQWARTVLADGFEPGELPPTLAARRLARWQALRHRILDRDEAMPRTADGLARWVEALADDDPLRQELDDALADARHLTDYPYDGRGRTFGEDPLLFWREVLRARVDRPLRTDPPPPTERGRALRILALAEDDDDLLVRSYAVFRTHLRRCAQRLGHGPFDDLLNLLPEDLLRWIDRGGRIDPEALARGRALFAAFEAHWRRGPRGDLRGVVASPGRFVGTAVTGPTLGALDETAGDIAVVRTLLPHDGIHVARFGAIVCETGTALGHAAVLAREHAVPCLIGVTDATTTIASGRRSLVDAENGRVELL